MHPCGILDARSTRRGAEVDRSAAHISRRGPIRMQELTTPDELTAALQAPEALLLKHGATCPISAAARRAMETLARTHPDLPIYGVEVTGHRALSDAVGERFATPHESPQLFLVRGGQPVWKAQHFAITPEAVAAQLGG
jgi:bacillithiol system protein YtxJ